MTPLSIVEALYPFDDRFFYLLLAYPGLPLNQLTLDSREECLRYAVVPAIAFAAHALDDIENL
jgi:hypothetical protein